MALTVILPSGVSNTGNFAVGSVSAIGNVTGNYILGNGALLTGVSTTSSNINNGTSNVTVVSSGGNITVGVGGTGNVAVFSTTGMVLTGNITANNGMFTNIVNVASHTGAVVSVTGNITGNNISVTSNVNIASTGTVAIANTGGVALSVTGNITGGNISATGNITANNGMFTNIVNVASHTGAVVSVTGNVIAGGGIVTRVVSLADATSVTINADTTDLATQTNTQVAGTLTINAPTGTLASGQKFIFRLQSSNVQTFSWNAVFSGSTDLSLPTVSSGSSKYDYTGFIYNTTATKWQILAKNFGF